MSALAAGSSTASSSSSSTSSPRCVPFAFRRGGGARGRLPGPASAGGTSSSRTVASGCGRPLCCAAEFVGEGIQNAFFASLDRCSCVMLRTDSFNFREPESETAHLIPHDDGSSSSSAATTRRGARRRASAAPAPALAGGKPRRGLGCCSPSSTSTVN